MRSLSTTTVALIHLISLTSQPATAEPDSKSSEKPPDPCTILSPSSGAYYDLNQLTVHGPGKKKHKDDRENSWHARGWDYGANFTINVCAPVIEKLTDVEGVDEKLWANVSAYYEMNGKTYSIGQASAEPIYRGKKLLLNYTGGSPCPSDNSKSKFLRSRAIIDDDDDDDDDDDSKKKQHKDKDDKKHDHDSDPDDSETPPTRKPSSSTRLKSTLLQFTCDPQPVTSQKTHIAFYAAIDSCAYIFEVKSPFACPSTISPPTASVGPGSVFSIIILIAIGAYLLGGIAYQRNVMHQRGWRQLPNYSLWAGMWGFVSDVVIILFGTCSRIMPRRKGYNHLPTSNGYGGGRAGRDEQENRLIDQLDEEWED